MSHGHDEHAKPPRRTLAGRRKGRRTAVALVCCAVAAAVAGIGGYAYAESTAPTCGLEEHTHTSACYSEELVCGCEEGEADEAGSEEAAEGEGSEASGHVHTDECYEQVLTCGLSEHTHTDECYPDVSDTPVGKALSTLADGEDEEDEDATFELDTNSYISALSSEVTADGTSPFDSDSSDGNDASDENGVVRTFDSIAYDVDYTTGLVDSDENMGSDEKLRYEFTLNCDPGEASWSTGSEGQMNWAEAEGDLVITYYYDGDGDGEADETTTEWTNEFEHDVEKQVVSGTYGLSQATSGVVSGTLKTGVDVKGMADDDTVRPTFKVWVEGNEDNVSDTDGTASGGTITCQPEEVTVSAAPKYNIAVLAGGADEDALAYYNLSEGTIADEGESSDTNIYGRANGYGVTLQLYNDSEDKGLMGIELPSGDFEFDLTVSANNGGEAYLWDYELASGADSAKTGTLGRLMNTSGNAGSSWIKGGGPLGKRSFGSTARSCYDGGAVTVEASGSGSWHVAVTGYDFDLEDLTFPTRYATTSSTYEYPASVGCFSAAYLQFVCGVEDAAADVTFKVTASGLSTTSLSGDAVEDDVSSSDDSVSDSVDVDFNVSTTGQGTRYTDASYSVKGTSSNSYQDASAYPGESIGLRTKLGMSGDGYLQDVNLLTKFDPEAIEIPSGTQAGDYTYSLGNTKSELGEITVLFAALPGKAASWEDDDELEGTREEGLVYFESIDGLSDAGYTCVGILYELRDCKIYKSDNALFLNFPAQVKTTATVGEVYECYLDCRAWYSNDEGMAFSWTDLTYGTSNGVTVYGLGESLTSSSSNAYKGVAPGSNGTSTTSCYYYTDYTQPTTTHYPSYTKATYTDGVFSYTNSWSYGNSLLVIGADSGVSISANREVYDLGDGQETVYYTVEPELELVYEALECDLVVTVEIPENIDYVRVDDLTHDGAVETTSNSDGSTTVTVTLYDCTAGSYIQPFVVVCQIDADEVEHAETYTASSEIYAVEDAGASTLVYIDTRTKTTANGNYDTTSFSIDKSTELSISKTIENEYVELGEDIVYTLSYTNIGGVEASDVYMIDTLPLDDYLGSSFSGGYYVESVVATFSDPDGSLSGGGSSTDDYDFFLTIGNDGESVTDLIEPGEEPSASLIESLLASGFEDVDEPGVDEGDDSTEDDDSTEGDSDGSDAPDAQPDEAPDETRGNMYVDDSGNQWIAVGYDSTDTASGLVYDGDDTIAWDNVDDDADMRAFATRLGTFEAGESVELTITLVPTTTTSTDDDGNEVVSSQQTGDVYVNKAYTNASNSSDSSSFAESQTPSATVVSRAVEGVAFEDADADGVYDEGESLLSGVTATLYRMAASGFDEDGAAAATVNGVSLYTAYDVYGEEIASVTTGEDGSYRFEDVEQGSYWVVFSSTTDGVSLSDYTLSSDAVAQAVTDDSGTLVSAYIEGVYLPHLYEVDYWTDEAGETDPVYVSEDNDVGLVNTASFEFTKTAEGDSSTALSGATFALYHYVGDDDDDSTSAVDTLIGVDENGDLDFDENGDLVFDATSWEQVGDAVESATDDTATEEDETGQVSFSGLVRGDTYRLVELSAPDGYITPTGQWNVVVESYSSETGEATYSITAIKGDTTPPAFGVYDDDDERDGYYLGNKTLTDLPSSGGPAWWLWLLLAGALLIAAGCAVWRYGKRRGGRGGVTASS